MLGFENQPERNDKKPLRMETYKRELDGSVKTYWFAGKNTDTYKAVQTALINLLAAKDISLPKSSDDAQPYINAIISLYSILINSCKDYLNFHSWPRFSDVGKQRKACIQQLLEDAIEEKSNIPEAIYSCIDRYNLFKSSYESETKGTLFNEEDNDLSLPTLGYALALARTQVIDITGSADVTKPEGEDLSDVIKIGTAEQASFFKSDEVVISPLTHMNSYFKNKKFNKISNKCKLILSVLLFNPCFKALELNISSELQSYKDVGCPKNCRTLQDLCISNLNMNQYIDKLFNKYTAFFNYNCDDIKKDFLKIPPSLLAEIFRDNHRFSNNYYIAKKAKISDGSNISKRNVATYRLARLLGINSIVTNAKSAIVREQGKIDRHGIVMEKAKGSSAFDTLCPQGNPVDFDMNGEAQRQLVNLQILDFLSGQIDRHPGNYFMTTIPDSNGKITVTGIQGIDNDMAFGLVQNEDLRTDALNMPGKRLPAFCDSTGTITLPFMDKDLANRILALTPERINFALVDLLSDEEICALIQRLKFMKKAISKKVNTRGFLKEKDEWGSATLLVLNSQQHINYVKFLHDAIRNHWLKKNAQLHSVYPPTQPHEKAKHSI